MGTCPARPPGSSPPEGQNRSPRYSASERTSTIVMPGGADRAAHRGVVRAHEPVFVGQGVAGGGRLGRGTAPGTALIPPRVAGAVQDAHVGVAVQLHQPETHGRPVPVADHRGVGADSATGQEPLHRGGVDQPVVGVLEVGVDVPQHGPVDVPFVVGEPAHVDLDHPDPGVVQVRFQPLGRHENVWRGAPVRARPRSGMLPSSSMPPWARGFLRLALRWHRRRRRRSSR